MTNLPAHSPRGGSAAERFISCPGYLFLLDKLGQLTEGDDPEYRAEGVAAHYFAADCLCKDLDGWEIMGETHEGIEAGEEMANAIQVYIDTVRPLIAKATKVRIEEKFHRPDLHPEYYGTADLAAYFSEEEVLDITDYKNGVGIVVDVEWNAQLMYYAYGLLEEYPGVRRVRLRIVQPRAFHPAGPVREWELSAESLCEWADKELLPAMYRKEADGELNAGDHCRFCPAKLVCPLLTSLFGAAAKSDPKTIINLDADNLGRSYELAAAAKHYIKALEEEVLRRLTLGKPVPRTKLVAKRANRVFKPGAEEVLKARFGDRVYTSPAFKSPAEIEKIGPDAKELMIEWAFTPFTGVTVALEGDNRPAVPAQTLDERFKGAAL